MAVTSGFYNGLNNDRKYSATQLSDLFEGIITDGVFMSIGSKLMVVANTGMIVNVGTGRAWFRNTWTKNDAILPLEVPTSNIVLNRIDTVVLEVNKAQATRANTIKIVSGVAATSPVKATLTNNAEVTQYPLAYIYVGAGVTVINQMNITNAVGTSECPFITGILSTMNIDALIAQWQDEWDFWSAEQQADFMEWFDNINALLGTEPATNLQLQVTAIKEPPLSKDIPVDVDYMVVADSTASNAFKKLTWANLKAALKTYFDTVYTSYVHPTTEKATPVDADSLAVSDSAAAGVLKKLTWANIKAALLSYFNTKYLTLTGGTVSGTITSSIGHSLKITSNGVDRGSVYGGTEGIGFSRADNGALVACSPLNTNNWQVIGAIVAGGNITAYSDARLKSNIETIPDALNKILALRGVEFDKDGEHQIGVIAQEVREIIPEVVLEGTDEKKTLSVAYGNLVGLLIEGMKEQQKQIDELKAKVH